MMGGSATTDHDADLQLLCPTCGYDLRGSASDRCSECGSTFDRATLTNSIVPWLNRARPGNWRAYWRTVWLVLRRPRLVGQEVAKPIAFDRTVSFRRATVAGLATLVTAVMMTGYVTVADTAMMGIGSMRLHGFGDTNGFIADRAIDVVLPTVAGWLAWPLIPLYVALFVQGVAGVSSYWFHPRSISIEQQNRALALSNLTAAPLMLLPGAGLVLLIAIAATTVDGPAGGYAWPAFTQFLFVLAFAIAFTSLVSFWIGTLKILRAATTGTGARQVLAAVVLPVMWLLVGLLTLIAMPWTVGYFSLLLTSLG